MGRKNIFDLLENSISPNQQIERIWKLASSYYSVYISDYHKRSETLTEFIDRHCFSSWKGQSVCADFKDFCKTLKIDDFLQNFYSVGENDFLNFLEALYNLWYLADSKISKESYFVKLEAFDQIRRMLDDCIEKLNYEVVYNKNEERAYIAEKNAAVRETAETESDKDTAIDILRYNYHSLKGNIKEKKDILIRMAAAFEPYRKQLKALGGLSASLESNISNILNNMDLRHNNTNPSDAGKYRESVAKMKDDEKEKWYDELYQMLILAKLEVNNIERTKEIEPLLKKLNKA